jgi:hypothetical protein
MFFDWLVGGQFLDGFTFPHSEPNWWVFWRLNMLISCSAKTD